MRHGKAVDLASLYETYSDMLFRTALTYVSHTEDAQDIVHDVLLIWQSGPPSRTVLMNVRGCCV